MSGGHRRESGHCNAHMACRRAALRAMYGRGVRGRLRAQVSGISLADPAPWGGAATIGEALLEPTTIYVEPVLKLIQLAAIKVRTAATHL